MLERSEFKLEYCDGVIYAMAGGTPAHAALSAAAIRVLGPPLLGSCTVFTSDLKVRVEASDLSTFPDVSIVCAAPLMSSQHANAVTNPSVLVEVTSRSTEDYDRGDKLSHYKQILSLRAVLFVSHRSKTITLVQGTAAGWEERDFRAGERLALAEPKVSFAVDDLSAGITLDPNWARCIRRPSPTLLRGAARRERSAPRRPPSARPCRKARLPRATREEPRRSRD